MDEVQRIGDPLTSAYGPERIEPEWWTQPPISKTAITTGGGVGGATFVAGTSWGAGVSGGA